MRSWTKKTLHGGTAEVLGRQTRRAQKTVTLLELRVSSLRRGQADLLCVVPLLTDGSRRESACGEALAGTELQRHPRQCLGGQADEAGKWQTDLEAAVKLGFRADGRAPCAKPRGSRKSRKAVRLFRSVPKKACVTATARGVP